jgi:hypothetical protein
MKQLLCVVLTLGFSVLPVQAKKLKVAVQIVNNQANTSEYTYTVPGYAASNCSLYSSSATASVNCVASGSPSRSAQFLVHGATYSLLLPDQRIVVVTCEAKTNWTDWHQGVMRSCRQPITDTVDAEFDGDKAKLEWSVSVDGAKKQFETYKIIGVLSKIPTQTEGSK